jgi:hypothetical protein
MTALDTHQRDIELLNVFLCRERSAYETYGYCLRAISDPVIHRALARLQTTHRQRVREIDRHTRALGGVPRAHSSIWTTLSRVIEASDGTIDESTMMSALQEYSSRMLRAYRSSLRDLSPETRAFIEERILPTSQVVHDSVVSLEGAAWQRARLRGARAALSDGGRSG